jgi:hypothetical protein
MQCRRCFVITNLRSLRTHLVLSLHSVDATLSLGGKHQRSGIGNAARLPFIWGSAAGSERNHRRYRQSIEIRLTIDAADIRLGIVRPVGEL